MRGHGKMAVSVAGILDSAVVSILDSHFLIFSVFYLLQMKSCFHHLAKGELNRGLYQKDGQICDLIRYSLSSTRT